MGTPLKIPSSLDHRGPLVTLGVFASLFLGGGLVMANGVFLQPWLENRAGQTWVETPCKIVSTGVSHRSGRSTDDVIYQYQVGGQNFQGQRYDFSNVSANGHGWLMQVEQKYRNETTDVCYVNPLNPSEAVLNRGVVNNSIGWIFSAILGLIGALMFLGMARGFIRRAKFGQSVFELQDAPARIGGVLAGTVTSERMVEVVDGFAMTLTCIHRVVTNTSKGTATNDRVVWKNKMQVMANLGGTIPVNFALPEEGMETSAASGGDKIFWKLDISAKVPGVDYESQFEVPVAKAVVSAAQVAAEYKIQAEEVKADERADETYELPAHSRIRVQDAEAGKEFYFPAMRNPGIVIWLTCVTPIWTAATWAVFHFGGWMTFPIWLIFGFLDLVFIQNWLTSCFGSSRVVGGGDGLTLTKHLFGLGWTQKIPAAEIKEIQVTLGTAMNQNKFYNVTLVRRNNVTQIVAANIPDTHEAHWLALEMARCAGMGK